MESRKKLIVEGFVQGVGYRAFVKLMAKKYRIKGKVRNLSDGNVEIIAIGDEENMKMFINSIKITAGNPFEPDVHRIVEEEWSGSEDFEDFTVSYGYEMSVPEKEMIERSEIGILAFSWMGNNLGNKIDSGFYEINNKMDGMGEKFESGFSNLGTKLDRISSKLDINTQKTEEFHVGMTDKFEYLDVKYGEFSNTMQLMLKRFEAIDELENDVKEMKDAFLKLVEYITEKK